MKTPETYRATSLFPIRAEMVGSPEGEETGHENEAESADCVCSEALNLLIYTELHGVYLKRAAVGESRLHYPPNVNIIS